MSFWADKLAGKQPSSAPEPVRAWWADEITPQQAPEPPAQPLPQPSPFVVQAPTESPSGVCPQCDSGNYMSSGRAAPRCFDCGYPVQHSTSGMAVSRNTPHGKPVRQVLGDGFHPTTIVDRGL